VSNISQKRVRLNYIKSALKGTRFESVDAVKPKATQLLKSITQDDLQHCFQQWKIRMERCRDRGGDYIEGDNISNVWFFFNKGLEHECGFFIAAPRTFATYTETAVPWYLCQYRSHKDTSWRTCLWTGVSFQAGSNILPFSTAPRPALWSIQTPILRVPSREGGGSIRAGDVVGMWIRPLTFI
jgi:hypothetical protein